MKFAPRVALTPAAAAGFLGVALVCLTPVNSEAAPILDQSQLLFETGNTLTCGGDPTLTTICGQAFTVGVTGTLTSISFELFLATGTVTPGLYTSVSGAGATLAQTSSTPLAFTTPGFYSFAFNYPVTAGQTLFFGLSVTAGDTVGLNLAATDAYAGGSPFGFVTPPSSFGTFDDTDAAFQTFVEPGTTIPEPATVSFLGLSLGGWTARRWRRRS